MYFTVAFLLPQPSSLRRAFLLSGKTMNLLKSLARKILKEELENNKYHFEKLGNENLAKSRRIKELESDNDRLRIKVEQIRQDNLKLRENRPHFKHHKKKGGRK
ncbi:hypothetical protein [Haemophilus influenzae]|uniref:hypothetical protein n=1 Tax=Haemophilus influenzae TaxID=727 RepID=UPI001F0CC486|nr:hypothetical protein [Haemophilus influenzae]MCK9649395.1 hypothetical protein [Haemophilus influenzae]MCK9651069.1 hypothetical protein [Haemophilus influenzae]MCK9652681.1 hypothetical protein [Haemophilus influenzae]MCK9659878.1 hypothetical protein [Haemophilus influenzae]